MLTTFSYQGVKMKDVILNLGMRYAMCVEAFRNHDYSLVGFYTNEFCAHLAYMVHRYHEKIGKPVSIGFIMDDNEIEPCPGFSNHIGIVKDGKFHDMEYINGVKLTEENINKLVKKYSGISFHIREGEYDDFEPACFEGKGTYKSFEEIVDSYIEDKNNNKVSFCRLTVPQLLRSWNKPVSDSIEKKLMEIRPNQVKNLNRLASLDKNDEVGYSQVCFDMSKCYNQIRSFITTEYNESLSCDEYFPLVLARDFYGYMENGWKYKGKKDFTRSVECLQHADGCITLLHTNIVEGTYEEDTIR